MADHIQQWVCSSCEEWWNEQAEAASCCAPECVEVGVLDAHDDWDYSVWRCCCCNDLYVSEEAAIEHGRAGRDEPWVAWYCRDCGEGGVDCETQAELMKACCCEDRAELEIEVAAATAPGGALDSEQKLAVAMSAPTDSYDGDYWKS